MVGGGGGGEGRGGGVPYPQEPLYIHSWIALPILVSKVEGQFRVRL